MANQTPDDIIEALGLVAHPEGGMFRETFRAIERVDARGGRSASTLIYFLLRRGEVSSWHRVNGSDEHFLYHGGDSYHLRWIDGLGELKEEIVGLDLAAGQRPQRIVPAGCWQAAIPDPNGTMGWSLIACHVSPGFDFADFEMATDTDVLSRYPALGERMRLPRP
jgi:predicted cupin superfamily sugar epimerase